MIKNEKCLKAHKQKVKNYHYHSFRQFKHCYEKGDKKVTFKCLLEIQATFSEHI